MSDERRARFLKAQTEIMEKYEDTFKALAFDEGYERAVEEIVNYLIDDGHGAQAKRIAYKFGPGKTNGN